MSDILTALEQSIGSAFPNWKIVDADLRHGYRDKVWYFHDGSQTVELFVDEVQGETFVSLTVTAAFHR